MNIRKYRATWLRLRDRYEKLGYKGFRKSIRNTALKIPFDQLPEKDFKIYIQSAIQESDISKAYSDFYFNIGLHYGKKVGASINKQTKNFSPDTFIEAYRVLVQQWVLSNGGQRIVSMRQTLIDYVVQFIVDGMSEGKDIRTISRELEKLVRSNGFYRWQIERIVRTETTAAANFGATVAGNDSGIELDKVWISSNDSRTRQHEKGDKYDHVDMDLIKVGEHDLFESQGDLLRFPGDPKGSASNVINCRCTVALVAKRDADGNLIRRGSNNPNTIRL